MVQIVSLLKNRASRMKGIQGGGQPPPRESFVPPDKICELIKNLTAENANNQGISSALAAGPSADPGKVTNTKTLNKNIDPNLKYDKSNSAPFTIYIEHLEKELRKLHPMRVGHYLKSIEKINNNIINVCAIGRNKVKVLLDNLDSANSLINNTILTKNNLLAYVPRHCVERRGIIKGVDTFFTEELILREIISEVKVTNVKRMYRWVRENNEKIPREMVILSFKGDKLPDRVYIDYNTFEVECYIAPVMQCTKCLHYGHTTHMCNSSKSLCVKCGEEHDNTENNPCNSLFYKCIHCKSSEHGSTSKKCPKYVEQRKIKQIMAVNNLSFKEAEKNISNPSYATIALRNSFAALENESSFPSLPFSLSEKANTIYTKTPSKAQSTNLVFGRQKNYDINKVKDIKKRKLEKNNPNIRTEPLCFSQHPSSTYNFSRNIQSQTNQTNTNDPLKEFVKDLYHFMTSLEEINPPNNKEGSNICKLKQFISGYLNNSINFAPDQIQ